MHSGEVYVFLQKEIYGYPDIQRFQNLGIRFTALENVIMSDNDSIQCLSITV